MRRVVAVIILISTLGWGLPTIFRTLHRRIYGVESGVYLEEQAMEYYYEEEVRVIVEQMARKAQYPPLEATIDHDTGEIIPHENGLYFDVDEVVHDVVSARSNTHLTLRGIEVIPFWRTEHLEEITEIIGDFSTPVLGSPARVKNINLSLEAINNILLMPGDVFSFNDIVGERTVERGYGSAPIILGEAVVPGVGGGICQTSTTLYNAVRLSGLEVIERRIHSVPPSYIKHGLDATVAWPHTDFKFKNNSNTPVIVKGAIQKWRVRVWILGTERKE